MYINILNFINKICITIEENSFISNLFYLYYIILLIFFYYRNNFKIIMLLTMMFKITSNSLL